jgi:hypothetical protein
MYPRYVAINRDGKTRKVQRGFIEFLTIFPDLEPQRRDLEVQRDFLRFLEQNSDFNRAW